MDQDLQKRIEVLEALAQATLQAVNELRADLAAFREEQRVEAVTAKTHALFRQR